MKIAENTTFFNPKMVAANLEAQLHSLPAIPERIITVKTWTYRKSKTSNSGVQT
jgi:hypothetical protein